MSVDRTLPRWIVVVCGVAVTAGAYWYWPRAEPVVEHPGEPKPVTFAGDVAPIIFAKCSSCHRPGESAPFNLLTFDDVRSHSRQIVEVTRSGFMPPWLPAAGHGDFVGSRRLTEQDKQLLERWVEAGSPPGDMAALPVAPVVATGWQAGPPDLVLESPPYTLACDGRDVFRNFVVPLPFDTPRWVQSIELRPDNPRATHHARLGVDSSNESLRRDAEDAAPGYDGMAWGQDPDGQLVIWAPGMVAHPGTPGVAWRLHPKSVLVLHTHMQPSGKTETVKFRIGIRFTSVPPQQHPAMLRIGSCGIDIPPGANRHVVTDQYTLPIEVDVQTIFPHAHSLCRELNVVAVRPDGSREPLITIERFDENWHDAYRYRQPVRLPRGTRLVSTFVYDNSAANIRNRHRPPRRVVYGSQASDEMADVYLQVTPVRADQRAVLMENYNRYDLQSHVAGYRKSLELTPADPWSQEGLAACYVGLGEPRKAVAILAERVKDSPKAVFPAVSLGMALTASGDAALAETQLRRAITLDGKYPLAWHGLGMALAAQKKSEAAEDAFRRAVALAPGSIDAHLNLTDLLLRRGQLDQAVELCAAALSESPDNAGIYLKLAEIKAKQKEYEASLEYCRKAQRLAPYTHPSKVLLAVHCCANGDQDRGVKLLQEARSESPVHPMPSLILGQLARRQQQLQPAKVLFTAAASMPIPDNWPDSHRKRYLVLLHSERVQLAQQLNDTALARDALTEWMKVEPENRQLKKMLDELPANKTP